MIAYGLVCSCVWGVLQTLAEMTIAFPTPGNYIDYADRWVDPALAFGAGFAEWLGYVTNALSGSQLMLDRMDGGRRGRSSLLRCPGSVLGRGKFPSGCIM